MKLIDRLSRQLTKGASRRELLVAASAGAVGGSLLGRSSGTIAQDATPEPGETVEFLFVQTAGSGTFGPNPAAGTPIPGDGPGPSIGADFLLTLESHDGHTIYFSDRPERIAGVAETQSFLDGLGFTPVNPPNAALVTTAEDGHQIVVVLELFTPVYDDETNSITYGAIILDEYDGDGLSHIVDQGTQSHLPESFGTASLFIDDCLVLTGCGYWGSNGSHIAGPISPPVRTCFAPSERACVPCDGEGIVTMASIADWCNATYPDDCQGRCRAWP